LLSIDLGPDDAAANCRDVVEAQMMSMRIHAGEKPKWKEIITGFTNPIPESEIKPNTKAVRVYDRLVEKYANCEQLALQ
jgi:hypothetical protein